MLAYANSFQAGLTVDSEYVVGLDPRIKAWTWENLRAIWTESYWGQIARSDLYRPVTTTSYLLNYAVLGNEQRVFGYHAVNFGLHALNAFLVFAVVRRLGAPVRVAWLAAAIFAVHPVNVEAVTNIVGRADLLAALGVLGAGWCYARAAESEHGARWRWLATAGVIALAGSFAKENAIMAIAFAMLFDLFGRGSIFLGANRGAGALRRMVLGWAVFVPAIAVWWGVRELLGTALTPAGRSFVDNPIQFAGPAQGFMTAIGVLGRYVALFFAPAKLSCDYSFNQIPLFGASNDMPWIAWLSLALIAAMIIAVFHWRKSQPLAAWGIAFFLVMLFPVSNVAVRIGTIMAERFLYLPGIGLCVVVAIGIERLSRIGERVSIARAAWPRIGIAVAAIVLIGLTLRTRARNSDWRDGRSIWQSAVEAAPRSFKTHLGLSASLWESGKNESALDAAIVEAERARDIIESGKLARERWPQTVFSQLGMFYRFKAEFLRARNLPEDARAFLGRSIAMLQIAREIDERENVALLQRLREGRAPVEPVLRGNAKLHVELAVSHMLLQDWPQLEAAARQIQRFSPSDFAGYAFAGVALANLQRDEESAIEFFSALALNPNDQEVKANLATRLHRLGIRSTASTGPTDPPLIDLQHPAMRRLIERGFARLIQNHRTAGFHTVAEQLREAAIRQFDVQPSALGARSP
jgi:tetratricopeptide (TPR) repeat protein